MSDVSGGSLIRARGVHKSFGAVHAVDDVHLHVDAGEVYGLVGPDGAGKTTFIRLLCGALHLDGGEIWMGGCNIAQSPEKAREQIGYLAQRFSLYEELTVDENLRFFATVRGLRPEQWKSRSIEILEFVGLAEFRTRRAGQLSGGMKQKLGLALALVSRPRILLLDEPTTGVDPVTRQDFWRLIGPLLRTEKVAVLVSTPYMDEAMRCTRVGFLRVGRIMAEGSPHELRQLLKGRILELAGEPRALVARIAADDAAVEAVQRFGNRLHLRLNHESAAAVQARLAATLSAAGVVVEELLPIEPQLEDVFIALAQGADLNAALEATA